MTAFFGHWSSPRTLLPGLEQCIGQGVLPGARQNQDWSSQTEGKILAADAKRGAVFCFRDANWDPPATFASVADGAQDDDINATFDAILGCGLYSRQKPYNLAVHHEQAVDNPVNQPSGGNPEDYAAMFAHVHEIGVQRKVLWGQGGYIRLAFIPVAGQYVPGSAQYELWGVDKIAPNRKHYAFCGCDYYLRVRSNGTTNRPMDASDLEYMHQFAQANKKKMIIGEISGPLNTPLEAQKTAQWLDATLARFKSWGDGGVISVNLTNKLFPPDATGKQLDMRLAEHPETAAVLKKWGADPFYNRPRDQVV